METLNTLKYANRARNIKNKVIIQYVSLRFPQKYFYNCIIFFNNLIFVRHKLVCYWKIHHLENSF